MQSMKVPEAHQPMASLSKVELHALADGLLASEPWVVEHCIEFLCEETSGLWHGRARAMMCRRLKHCALGRAHRTQLLACILTRLSSGSFSEQFKDQLRLAMHLDLAQTLDVSRRCVASSKPHVRRYAEWVIRVALAHGEEPSFLQRGSGADGPV